MRIPHIVTNRAYSIYESHIEKDVINGNMPKHIAIIMDGNRRYAREILGMEPIEGYRLGKDKLEEVLHWCLKLNIQILTVYALSTENFKRDKNEVDYIMNLLERSLYEFADNPEVHKHKVAIRMIGNRCMLPDSVIEAIDYAVTNTKNYHNHYLNMAIAYGGRQDITNAVRNIVQDVIDGKTNMCDIDEAMISGYISTYNIPDPDLVLRTSGEIRISNFLLWQIAYSEFYFIDVYWPGFRYIDLLRAIRTLQQRKRRYGR